MVTLLENTVPRQQKPFTNLDQIQQIILARRIDGNGEKWKYCMSVFWNYQSLFFPLTKMLKNVGEKKKEKGQITVIKVLEKHGSGVEWRSWGTLVLT